jgi:hypothetical protein
VNDYIKKKQISKYSKKNLIFLSNKKMAFEVSKKRKQQLVESQLQSYSKSFEQRIEAGFDEYEIVEHRDEIAFEDGFTDYMEYIYTVDDDNPDVKKLPIPEDYDGNEGREQYYIAGLKWARDQPDIEYIKSVLRQRLTERKKRKMTNEEWVEFVLDTLNATTITVPEEVDGMKRGGCICNHHKLKNKYKCSTCYGVGGYIASAGTFIFGNATQRMKNFMRDHGEEEITSIKLGREPIKSAIASVMELISLGEFSKSQEKRGYDAFFHLYLILNDKYVLEKNQNVNYKSYTPNDNEEIFDVSLSGLKGKTINEFIKNGEQFMGENKYWQGYNPLVNNCQKWVESNLQANDVDSEAAKDFYYQDTEDLIQAIEPNVQDFLEETTDVASGLEKFISWLSDGAWGFKKGGMVRRRIGYMK